MLRYFDRLVRSWWNHDRIRASPREGRLLRLEPGDILTVRGREAVVRTRIVKEYSDGTSLLLMCETDTDPAVMEMRLTPEGCLAELRWIDAGGQHPCDPNEVETWPRRRVI